jgi:hypothetical protein
LSLRGLAGRVVTNRLTPHFPLGSAAPADTHEMKEGPGGEAGAFKETSQSRDQGALDASILSQSTNQARRGLGQRVFEHARRFVAELFSSQAGAMRGSQNLAGMSDPVIDALIDKIIAADNRTSLTTACRVLDRVIRTGRYWVPHWYKASPQCLHSEYGPAVQEFVPLLAPRAALRK